MTIDKEEILKELRKFDNIVTDYWELQKNAATDLFTKFVKELNEEDIKKILEIAENSNIGQIAKDALDISATQILEEEEYSFSDNK